ncbi:oxygen-independent coproporphyrinogen III oxidase [Brumimicrobium aurantiacum]|uniref:Coproporphyrinogen-III oxidase n=1 Tax=Brumimicrobium aurantiacum TaxID=1737063 RepID=A0A3E1EUY7_9FLAO|nr:oxygen-independent coproporphyrinogen III oxidase [Brumimicrobium aurantiacum]RFC53379.1 oxygen-independent coproporphyrinogen III oxidase [Brumimicrobium aurantiacum]
MKELIRKYNTPGPRYTSYPTVPFWEEESINNTVWSQFIKEKFGEKGEKEISLYIHLPFCENLCTFCGCHKRITKNHKVEEPYIDTLIKEWKLYTDLLGKDVVIKEIHLGGGTPTFFAAEKLKALILNIKANSNFCTDISMSFEAHPNNTTQEHLQSLYDIGFRRLSLGIQDYDAKVQKTINRVQSFEQVAKVHNLAKEIGYTSISHDIIYGLPFQKLESIAQTIDYTSQLKPERISFYSYAHVPWIKGVGQRGYSEQDLPKNEEKQALYEYGKSALESLGYKDVGMDHFALEDDELYLAQQNGELHRNFMGYTTQSSDTLIGLGMSAISDAWGAFAQNEKHVEDYQQRINQGELAIFRGHLLNEEDLIIRRIILDLMCTFTSEIPQNILTHALVNTDLFNEMKQDVLVNVHPEYLELTEKGKPFIRNLCMCFDLRLNRKKVEKNMFSSTI